MSLIAIIFNFSWESSSSQVKVMPPKEVQKLNKEFVVIDVFECTYMECDTN